MVIRPVRQSTYNRQGHMLARDNYHQPYPSQSQIKDHAVKSQHHLEKYQDVFIITIRAHFRHFTTKSFFPHTLIL